ncbi:MAG TPA: acyl-CoA dehydrogenase [Sneathiellales bacterium]|nr:acyl-CoA dehydrogenase [Sneathiellales bacterium]
MALDPETLDQLLVTLRKFVVEKLVPLEAQVAEDDLVPPAIVEQMKELGLFGLSIPEEYGGLGLNMEEESLAVIELSRTSPAFRSVFGTNVGIGSQGIVIDGTEAQKQKYLPRLATGELVSSFALTEPGAGSDAGSLRTSARLEGDEYVLNGTKRFITNAKFADVFTVMARTDPDTPGARGVSSFLVDRKTPGLSIGKSERKMGQQGAHISDVIFDDCRVPADAIIGGAPGQGFKTAMKVLDKGRIHLGAMCVGVSERILDDSLKYAIGREQFGKPIAEFELVQAMLADSKAEVYAARTMVMDAARRRDAGEDISTEAACCKMFGSEMAGRVADRAVQIFGGAGYLADHGIERFYRDVRVFRIYEGTTQIQQLVIARNMIRQARASM